MTLRDDSFPWGLEGFPGTAEGTCSTPVSDSAPVLVETWTPPLPRPPFVSTDGGSSLGLSTGNLLHVAAELLGGAGGGEPDHRRLRELPACPGPKDAAVLGSAGLGADSRNRTQVRGGGQPTPLHQCAAAFLFHKLICSHLTSWGEGRHHVFDGTRHKSKYCQQSR